MEVVKGMSGKSHLTNGDWDKSGNRLMALCGVAVSPNYRQRLPAKVECEECLSIAREHLLRLREHGP